MTTSAPTEYGIGESIGRLAGAVEALNQNINRHDLKIDGLSTKLEKFIMESVSRKEFEDSITRLKALEEKIQDKEKAWGILETLKNNWKFIFSIIFVGGGLGFGTYQALKSFNDDIHTIAVAHQNIQHKR